MDLYAYAQIEDLSQVMEDNGINMPRLRGLRLMKDEEPEDISEIINNNIYYEAEYAIRYVDEYILRSWMTEQKRLYRYIIYAKYTPESKYKRNPVGIKWDKLHGKLRKKVKFAIKNKKKRIIKQYEMWNKYVGRDDILYVHTRCGGYNWNYYKNQIESQPGYLESVEDSFDRTYLDSYFKIAIY